MHDESARDSLRPPTRTNIGNFLDCGSQTALKSKFQFSPSSAHANFQSARVFRGPVLVWRRSEKRSTAAGLLRGPHPPGLVSSTTVILPFKCHANRARSGTTTKSILNTFRVSKVRLRSFMGCEFFPGMCAVAVESFESTLTMFCYSFEFFGLNIVRFV